MQEIYERFLIIVRKKMNFFCICHKKAVILHSQKLKPNRYVITMWYSGIAECRQIYPF